MAQKNIQQTGRLVVAIATAATLALSSVPAQADIPDTNTSATSASSFSLNYSGSLSEFELDSPLLSSFTVPFNVPVSGTLLIDAQQNTPEETQTLLAFFSAGRDDGSISNESGPNYSEIIGAADVMTPGGAIALSFSADGIDVADQANFADRIATCVDNSCVISGAEITIQNDTTRITRRYGDLVANLPAPPKTVPEAGSVLSLVLLTSLVAGRRKLQRLG